MIWQRHGADDWVYGKCIRGIVRHATASVYFDESLNDPHGGWVWLTREHGRGIESSLSFAVEAAEKAMVIAVLE